MRSPIDHVRC